MERKDLNVMLHEIYKDLGEEKINEIFMDITQSSSENASAITECAMRIPFLNKSSNPTPKYGSERASGFDLRADLKEPVLLKPLERSIIPTGLYFGLPQNIELQVRPRSGLAANHGITVLNTPGTVDSDYRGEVGIILVNLSNEVFTINHGDRVAQAVLNFSPGQNAYSLNKVDSLDETERGSDGFGSTGVK